MEHRQADGRRVSRNRWLQLGRVSNLPTVWSNVLAGAFLSGGAVSVGPLLCVAFVGSLFYVGGMYLNDAFDADIDARERPERPIPSGRVARRVVFALGFAMLGLGLLVLLALVVAGLSPSGFALLGAGAATALAVIAYDRWHKGHPLSPVIMGLCRAGLYVMAALAFAPRLSYAVLLGAAALAAYVIGLTHIARFETASMMGRSWPSALVLTPVAVAVLCDRPDLGTIPTSIAAAVWLGTIAFALSAVNLALRGGPSIGRAVGALIAGIALADASLIVGQGALSAVAFALFAFLATRWAQKHVRGT